MALGMLRQDRTCQNTQVVESLCLWNFEVEMLTLEVLTSIVNITKTHGSGILVRSYSVHRA